MPYTTVTVKYKTEIMHCYAAINPKVMLVMQIAVIIESNCATVQVRVGLQNVVLAAEYKYSAS